MIKRVYDWIDLRIGIREIVRKELTGYLLPRNINEWYSLGSVLLVIFVLQVLTGVLLLVYYVPESEKAFKSVTTIMNNIEFGWLIRLCHAVGSNLMVAVLFLHMLSTLVMGSYKSPRELNWITGFLTFALVETISLTGYLLPWSQLSFWATTVATNSMSAVPIIGPDLVEFMRGSKLVGPATLGRFFALHVAVIPIAIVILIVLHLFVLKRTGISTPPFGKVEESKTWPGDVYRYESHPGGIPLIPNFALHDLSSILIYFAIFLALVFFAPTLVFTPDAFVPANAFKTPPHIKPEWYFLANYQTLKIFPSELAGMIIQGLVILFLLLLPFIDRSHERRPHRRPIFLTCVIVGVLLWFGLTVWGHYS
jgi:ubiquinol-cytochrome c reductase cytochrome b subunit